jgi:prepilin-type N-terminal cleavage/methylation domain-containing protein
MISPIGNRIRNDQARCAGGFTLVELILVMALLVIAISLVTPSLSRFFRARKVDSEVNRFLALAHYGQSRAVSEGMPTMLWIDPRAGTYGLKIEPGYSDNDLKAVEYTVGDTLKIDVAKPLPAAVVSKSQTGRIMTGQAGQTANKLSAIHFSPEGSINSATSVSNVTIQEITGRFVRIGLSTDGLNYEIQK